MQKSFFSLPPTHCRMCGRLLTAETSKVASVGPVCRAKHSPSQEKDMSDFQDFTLFDPLENGLILRRESGNVWTNVPHVVTHHSPTGYEFGYGGSGPADLALNICEVMLNRLGYIGPRTKCWDGDCFELAFQLHQAFKWQFIATQPRETGGVIPYADLVSFFQSHIAVYAGA